MMALLQKDWYVLLKQGKLFLLMIVLFALLPGMSLAGFAIIYAAMLPYTALAYDERSKWDMYAAMMPYSRTALVMEKYVLGWCCVGGAAALSALVGCIRAAATHASVAEAALGAVATAGVALLLMALTLPPMFRYGVEKGRMLFMAIVVLVALVTMGLFSALDEGGVSSQLQLTMVAALPLAGLLAQPLSIALSTTLYAAAHR